MSDFGDSDLDLDQSTPPDLKDAASSAIQNLLPEKSKARYEKEYISYKNWCKQKSVTNIGSENVVIAYFSELSKNKKASTLWSTYSMLRSTLNLKDNIDISKHNKLMGYLKKMNVGYKAKKSNVFTKKDIDTFLKSAPLEYLPQKVALIIGISGACRSDELFKMKISHQPRAFIINNPTWISIIKQYVDLRNNAQNERLFLQLRYGKLTKQPFGHNTIAKFPKRIASYLQLANVDSYTGHTFRCTAATLLVNQGDVLQLKRLGGWKSSAIAESYVASSLDSQVKTANMLSLQNSTTRDLPGPSSSVTNQEFTISNEDIKHGLSVTVHSSGNSNVTVNLNLGSK